MIIFPEHEVPHNHIVYDFQEGFVDVARRYHKVTGKELKFVPMYVAPKLKSMYLGEAIVFDSASDIQTERKRLCRELKDAITALAEGLPKHTVVPYPNISPKDYPTNLPSEVTKS